MNPTRHRSTPRLALLAAALVGCAARTSASEPPGDAPPGADAVADDAPPAPTGCALTWTDDGPIARGVDRYVAPVLTGDRDGFLFVSAMHPADPDATRSVVIVERFASSGGAADSVRATLERPARRVRLFAGTDVAGAAHYAVAGPEDPYRSSRPADADAILWAASPAWTATHTLPLAPERGLGAVAFDGDDALVLTHEWRSEGTIGEGGLVPIHPRIERASPDGAVVEGPRLDPTEGTYFVSPTLTASNAYAWLVTASFYGGSLRAAGAAWTGLLRGYDFRGRHAVAATEDGSLVIADDFDGVVRVARVDRGGVPREVTTLPDSATTASLAIASYGGRVLVVHHSSAGGVRATVLDATLAVRATGVVPGAEGLGDFWQVGAAAAADGSFALFAGPGASTVSARTPVPMTLRRFRACE